ncbi:MAG: hypothetical protein AVDCRST_MAG64-2053 [uncultured Phycisphaerae bacterium]|uniref:Uncharacterized protein n=1 Tax=uncultured Phycisphaerae bacterium TaxID=904963 RepID=A0A6J4NTE2_9BACT|nr:MAG: hypothetical protein AVDCRST_MAG64-2053 [uncultured Phycisphaerae bacterium]
MVLCVAGDGHLSLELAHVRHAESHAEGADHDRHDSPADADHGELHDALDACSDSSVVKVDRRAARPESLWLEAAYALPCLTARSPDLRPALASVNSNGCATPARTHLARLSVIVLLV